MKPTLFIAVALLAVTFIAGCGNSPPAQNQSGTYKVTQHLPDGKVDVYFTKEYPNHNDLLLSFKDATTGKWVTISGSFNVKEQ